MFERKPKESSDSTDINQIIIVFMTAADVKRDELSINYSCDNKSFWKNPRKYWFLITWLNGVTYVNDDIIATVLRTGGCFIDNDVCKKWFFANNFFWEINSVSMWFGWANCSAAKKKEWESTQWGIGYNAI